MTGYATITADEIPAPTVPDGWQLAGYGVEFDVPPGVSDFAPAIAAAIKTIEQKLTGCLAVTAECVRRFDDPTGRWEERMRCHWRPGRHAWTDWRPA